jgi:hypothetical protein
MIVFLRQNICLMMRETFSLFLPSDFRLDDGLKNAIAKGFSHDIYKPVAFLNGQNLILLAKLTSVVIVL